jgi:hypothetical protein
MYVDCNPLLHRDRVVHTPLSVRQGLRLGTMTVAEARGHLASWGESERDIQVVIDTRGWTESTPTQEPSGTAVPTRRDTRD